MPQTLLALFALALASYLSLGQQQLALRSQENTVGNEVGLAAAGLASEVMAFVESRSFDEATSPEAIHSTQNVPTSPNDFSPASDFGAADRGTDGCNLVLPALTPVCDDVDDVSGMGWVPTTLTLAHDRSLDFEVRLVVFYVSSPESMAESPVRTLHKRVVIDVRSPHVTGDEVDGLVRLTRVVSYDPIKAEKDYEDPYGPLGTSTS